MGRTNKRLLKTLIAMHEYCRPMGTATEQAFIDAYISNLPNAERDPHGNWHVTVDDTPILWSCHTDTVHAKEGMQWVSYNRKTGNLTLPKWSASSCLGADDTAGVFLCREMILAKVPGHYVFHYGEERGGIGSGTLADKNPEFLRGFDFAIALDRQGHSDVITHQGIGRTASDAFAVSLAKQLGGYYAPCAFGIYTDTEEYCGLIPECTNVSIGYTRAHSHAETLDTRHVFRLLQALKKINIAKLICARKPARPVSSWALAKWNDDAQDVYSQRDFLDAEDWDSRWDTLLKEDLIAEDNDRLDNYLDPTYCEVQRELKRQLEMRIKNGKLITH
jgi:hypothetical protein